MRKSPIQIATIRTAFTLGLVFIGGCREQEQNTPTSGRATVLASESIAQLIQSGAAEFQRIYPSVAIRVLPGSTREAFVRLLNDSIPAIAVDRPLNDEERAAATAAGLNITENHIGNDAIVVLVPPENGLHRISLPLFGDILSGRLNRWEEIPGSGLQGPIRLVLTGRNSGLYEVLALKYGDPKNAPQPSVVAATQEEVVRSVSKDRLAVGMILFSGYHRYRADRTHPIRALSLQLPDTTVPPTQHSVYLGLYPLALPLYYYTLEQKPGTASGFATFLKSLYGQKLMQEAGVVPVAIPSRTIQFTQEY